MSCVTQGGSHLQGWGGVTLEVLAVCLCLVTWVCDICGGPTEFLRVLYLQRLHQPQLKETETGRNGNRLSCFQNSRCSVWADGAT